MPRVMELVTPLGPDVLLFKTLKTEESLGRLFDYDIMALSFQSDIDPNAIIGNIVTVNLELPNGGTRYFNGYVTSFGWTGMEAAITNTD
jgi:type VI secretion system secreted protein VgrG